MGSMCCFNERPSYLSQENGHLLRMAILLTNYYMGSTLAIERECKRRLRYLVFGGDRQNSRADGEELDNVRTPTAAVFIDIYADDTLRTQTRSFGLHSLHRTLACIINGLRIVSKLDVLPDLPHHLA